MRLQPQLNPSPDLNFLRICLFPLCQLRKILIQIHQKCLYTGIFMKRIIFVNMIGNTNGLQSFFERTLNHIPDICITVRGKSCMHMRITCYH